MYPASDVAISPLREAARVLEIELIEVVGESLSDFAEQLSQDDLWQRVNAILIMPDPLCQSPPIMSIVDEHATKYNLPVSGFHGAGYDHLNLFAYFPMLSQYGVEAAVLVE